MGAVVVWPAGCFIAGLLAAEIHMGLPVYGPGCPTCFCSRSRCGRCSGSHAYESRCSTGRRRAPGRRAHLPLSVISRTATIPPSAKTRRAGPSARSGAFVTNRSWVKQTALIVLDDPEDPTPYWLVSTRRPAELRPPSAAGLRPRRSLAPRA
ncbi:DUF3093 family protein [Rhodococcus hoagii]|nr:DUF3093 family protein [Prescottella equi]